jgi:MOSC domain-containing protein YiiM
MYRRVISEAAIVAAVAAGKKHRFSKEIQSTITLLAGLGVEGDAHCGAYVQHLYDQAKDPTRPNLRQVHLVEQELLEQLGTLGFALKPGQLGENITTRHIDLPWLDAGMVLQLGTTALVRITGLREPCVKLARFQKGLQKAVTAKRDGRTFMRGAVMGVVVASGEVSAGDAIQMRQSAGAASKALYPV